MRFFRSQTRNKKTRKIDKIVLISNKIKNKIEFDLSNESWSLKQRGAQI